MRIRTFLKEQVLFPFHSFSWKTHLSSVRLQNVTLVPPALQFPQNVSWGDVRCVYVTLNRFVWYKRLSKKPLKSCKTHKNKKNMWMSDDFLCYYKFKHEESSAEIEATVYFVPLMCVLIERWRVRRNIFDKVSRCFLRRSQPTVVVHRHNVDGINTLAGFSCSQWEDTG